MFVVGVDLSINYPAICVTDDFGHFEFVGFVNDPRISGANLNYLLKETPAYDGVTIVDITGLDRSTRAEYHANERMKLLNFNHIVSSIALEIRKRVDPRKTIIAMEGISYGSKGAALIDICMLTGAFRTHVLNALLDCNANRFFVFSPSELKNAIGLKGNATKTEIYAQFNDDPGIPAAADCGLAQFMRERVSGENASAYVMKAKDEEICSPFNDMIDAYLCTLKIYGNVR